MLNDLLAKELDPREYLMDLEPSLTKDLTFLVVCVAGDKLVPAVGEVDCKDDAAVAIVVGLALIGVVPAESDVGLEISTEFRFEGTKMGSLLLESLWWKE